jgi:flavocytochrome c
VEEKGENGLMRFPTLPLLVLTCQPLNHTYQRLFTSNVMQHQAIVVGSGLAGLVAAHSVLQHSDTKHVLLLEKNAFLGGNSIKASSGINGAPTDAQHALGITDTTDAFYGDTATSSGHLLREHLVHALVNDSKDALSWLTGNFGIPLDHVKRLGGHGTPRTHHPASAVGWTLTSTLSKALEGIEGGRVVVLKKTRVIDLLYSKEQHVHGVVYQTEGSERIHAYGQVILATGGYAGDKTANSLLVQHKPDYAHLPTTNGDWSTGDGVKMALKVGANVVDMDQVQVHPTGLVDPAHPDAMSKFLAAEALRGVGGLLLDAQGRRFCDELGTRAYVTAKMWANQAPFYLVLNEAGVQEAQLHVGFYTSKGLMAKYDSAAEFAQKHGMSTLENTLVAYAQGAGANVDTFGKKYFTNTAFAMDQPIWVAVVTPVLHFTMGGVEMDEVGRALSKDGTAVPGLYVAGEVSGGVHGANRLGGNSLLECVVFGRRAGQQAALD